MSDQYTELRELPLAAVLAASGVSEEWKSRKGGTEQYGRCPFHQSKNNRGSFSFHADGRFNCFSCSKKGRGAIDLVKALRGVGFQEAVDILSSVQVTPIPAGARKPEIRQLQQPVQEQPAENPSFKGS